MELFGIKFIPFKELITEFPYVLGATFFIISITFSGPIGTLLSLYLILYTRLRWIVALYLFWIWFIDKDKGETGGRRSVWLTSMSIWRYMKEYFPIKLHIEPGVKLHPGKNYLFCVFPHGILPVGCTNNFSYQGSGYRQFFPHHQTFIVTLAEQFYLPFGREMILALGGISNSSKSIDYVISRPSGGNICVISVGGTKEALYSKPGTYRLALKSKRGFVRLALKNGTPLVPVFSFGETDLYDQLDGPVLRKVQEFMRRWIVVSPVLPIGRGFFQYSFGIVPRRHPINTVVGQPIEVPKIADPTKEEIDKYHAIFVEKLIQLFEQHKSKYVENPDVTNLIID